MNYTGTSMGGRIVNTRKVKSIPCDCGKCYHKRRNSKEKYNYCSYYEIVFPTKKSRCARYSGPPVTKLVTGSSKAAKTCKNCTHYTVDRKMCNKFNFQIRTYGLGSKCKGYSKLKY